MNWSQPLDMAWKTMRGISNPRHGTRSNTFHSANSIGKKSVKIFTYLFLALAILSGCTSTNSSTDVTVADTNSNPAADEVALTGSQARNLIVGNTLIGRSNNFPQVGPIDFWIFYGADGTAKDRLRFVRGGKIDRGTGTWKIEAEQGLFCSTFAKRRNGAKICTRIYVVNDQFRTEPVNPNQKGVNGRIVTGDQVQ